MSSNWIENKGRKRAPFAKGTLIDVKYRDGTQRSGVKCGAEYACDWEHDNHAGDILEYRKHEVSNEQE